MSAPWTTLGFPDGTAVVVPNGDAVEHTIIEGNFDECVCGPRTEAVPRSDGSFGWIYVHHSLDGRT